LYAEYLKERTDERPTTFHVEYSGVKLDVSGFQLEYQADPDPEICHEEDENHIGENLHSKDYIGALTLILRKLFIMHSGYRRIIITTVVILLMRISLESKALSSLSCRKWMKDRRRRFICTMNEEG
jgi:hypothetical protein